MSPEHARIFIAEDVKRWRRIVKRALKQARHDVILTASTLPEAMEKVHEFKDKDIQVAVIDGNMGQKMSNKGQDGEILAKAIRAIDPKIKIIGMSSHPINGVDKNVLKGNERLLGKVVNDI